MQDRFLFKGKRVDNGEWVVGCYWFVKNKHYILINSDKEIDEHDATRFEVIPETVSQCMGLTDKNGNLIFEEDYLKDDENFVWQVVWLGGMAKFVINCDDLMATKDLIICQLQNYYTICGNRWDNPELLEEKQ